MSQIKVYGADWCEDTRHARRHLEQVGIRYDYLNIDFDSRRKEFVIQQNEGKQVTPTVVIAGDVLVEPDDRELDDLLQAKGLMPGQVPGGPGRK